MFRSFVVQYPFELNLVALFSNVDCSLDSRIRAPREGPKLDVR